MSALLLPLPDPPEWTHRALCAEVDPDLWFPETGVNAVEAKALCRRCEARSECLEHALVHETSDKHGWGVWGGLSCDERMAELRRRGLMRPAGRQRKAAA